MIGLSEKEIEILLLLAKDINADYNSNNITRKIKITSAGAFKAMKKLEKQHLIVGKQMGKAVFYSLNYKDDYAIKIMETIFIQDARLHASRWIDEFSELYPYSDMVILYGSTAYSNKKANDIDLLIVAQEQNFSQIDKIIKERRIIAIKPIHAIKKTKNEITQSLKRKDEILLDILKSGYILHGSDNLLKVVRDVRSI